MPLDALVRSDVENLLNNQAWQHFIADMQERYDKSEGIVTSTLLKDQETIALVSQNQGIMQNIEFINGWIGLVLLEIEEREKALLNNKKEDTEDGTGTGIE